MANLTLALQGSLSVTPDQSCSTAEASSTATYTLDLVTLTKSADVEASQQRYVVNSPSAFVAVGVPAGTYKGRVMLLRILEGGPLDVKVTFETAGAVTIPVKGLLVLEPPDADRIEDIEVQGTATFMWITAGVQS